MNHCKLRTICITIPWIHLCKESSPFSISIYHQPLVIRFIWRFHSSKHNVGILLLNSEVAMGPLQRAWYFLNKWVRNELTNATLHCVGMNLSRNFRAAPVTSCSFHQHQRCKDSSHFGQATDDAGKGWGYIMMWPICFHQSDLPCLDLTDMTGR